jgi:hypothetical protein
MKTFPIGMTVDEMMRRAREIAAVDIVDDEIVEPLTILSRAYSEEAQLDREGAHERTRQLVRLLANRMRFKRDIVADYSIREETIKGPLVILVVARSGTT